ncbi:MAG: MFS transporter [Planctomycetota bacterium]
MSVLTRMNPLRGVPNKREVLAWSAYDLANQSFTLLIITLLFPSFFRDVVVGDPVQGARLWSVVSSSSLLIVVLVSPFVGAFADAGGFKKRLLIATGLGAGVSACALTGVGAGEVWFAALLFIAGNVCYQVGENLLAAFLPEIATPRNVARISAFGWASGYAGALVLLAILAGVSIVAPPTPDGTRWFFLLAGLWFLTGIMVPALGLRESRPMETGDANPVAGAFRRLTETVSQATKYRQLVRFLVAFFVFAMGVQTVVYFAGILLDDFGFDAAKKFLFMLQLTLTAGIGAVASGFLHNRLGSRNTVYFYLGVWIATCLGLVVLTAVPPASRPEWLFWIVGNGFGVGLGGIGSASRAAVGRFTPTHKTAEFFGLWGMAYKLAGAVGALAFGQTKAAFGTATFGPGGGSVGDVAALALLTLFFVVGAVLLGRVDERAGLRRSVRENRAIAALRPMP